MLVRPAIRITAVPAGPCTAPHSATPWPWAYPYFLNKPPSLPSLWPPRPPPCAPTHPPAPQKALGNAVALAAKAHKATSVGLALLAQPEPGHRPAALAQITAGES